MSEQLFSSISSDRKRFLKIMVSISIEIRKARKERGMTQKEFADFMGVKQAMVSKWESGHYNFTMETIVKIYDKLDLPLNFETAPEQPKQSAIIQKMSYLKKISPPAAQSFYPNGIYVA